MKVPSTLECSNIVEDIDKWLGEWSHMNFVITDDVINALLDIRSRFVEDVVSNL